MSLDMSVGSSGGASHVIVELAFCVWRHKFLQIEDAGIGAPF